MKITLNNLHDISDHDWASNFRPTH
jgi:hypothetical protein